jgi:hypothetical protein
MESECDWKEERKNIRTLQVYSNFRPDTTFFITMNVNTEEEIISKNVSIIKSLTF